MTATEPTADRKQALTATGDDLSTLIQHHSPDVLLALLDNPTLD